MKILARSKAAKREASRRGRPYDGSVDREPNGRASRAKKPAIPADLVALTARAKHLGISIIQAKDQRAATFIGYLAMLGPRDGISDRQYQAAQDFLELRGDYLRSKNAPGAEYDPDGRSGGDFITPRYEEWCKTINRTYMECREVIQDAQNETRQENLWAALDLVVIGSGQLDHTMIDGKMLGSLIGATRMLCNALAKFFKRD